MMLPIICCLVFLQTTTSLKVTRSSPSFEFLNKVSKEFKHAFNGVKIGSKQSFAAVAIGTSIALGGLGFPMSSSAASGLVASSLFDKADQAVELNLQDYLRLDKEWAVAKKIVSDNQILLTKGSTALSTASKQMSSLEVMISTMTDEDSIAIKEISDEIANLKESTGMKYAAAEASSAIPAKPAVTANLFKIAQREASLLEQSQISFKKFTEAIGPPGKEKKSFFSRISFHF